MNTETQPKPPRLLSEIEADLKAMSIKWKASGSDRYPAGFDKLLDEWLSVPFPEEAQP